VSFHVHVMYIKIFNNLSLLSLSISPFSHLHLHGHETFDINNNELLGTIWEHIKKRKEEGWKFFLVWNLAKGQNQSFHLCG